MRAEAFGWGWRAGDVLWNSLLHSGHSYLVPQCFLHVQFCEHSLSFLRNFRLRSGELPAAMCFYRSSCQVNLAFSGNQGLSHLYLIGRHGWPMGHHLLVTVLLPCWIGKSWQGVCQQNWPSFNTPPLLSALQPGMRVY